MTARNLRVRRVAAVLTDGARARLDAPAGRLLVALAAISGELPDVDAAREGVGASGVSAREVALPDRPRADQPGDQCADRGRADRHQVVVWLSWWRMRSGRRSRSPGHHSTQYASHPGSAGQVPDTPAASSRRAFATPSGSIERHRRAAVACTRCRSPGRWARHTASRRSGAPCRRSRASSAGEGVRMKFFSRRNWWNVMSRPWSLGQRQYVKRVVRCRSWCERARPRNAGSGSVAASAYCEHFRSADELEETRAPPSG